MLKSPVLHGKVNMPVSNLNGFVDEGPIFREHEPYSAVSGGVLVIKPHALLILN